MSKPVGVASLSRIYLAYRQFKTHLLLLSRAPNQSPAQPPFETPPLASSLSLHSLKNCPTYIQVTPHYNSSIYYVIHHYPMLLCLHSALLMRIDSVSHMSVLYSTRVVSHRSVQPSGIPCLSQLRTSCSTIHTVHELSRNNLNQICLPQPSPLVELSPMRLWFDDLLLAIYLVVFDFVCARPNLQNIGRWRMKEKSPIAERMPDEYILCPEKRTPTDISRSSFFSGHNVYTESVEAVVVKSSNPGHDGETKDTWPQFLKWLLVNGE